MKRLIFFSLSFCFICFSSCKKEGFVNKVNEANVETLTTNSTESENDGRTLQHVLFSDRLDFDNTISQTSGSSEFTRQLIPYFHKPEDAIYKYLFIEQDNEEDIKNFEYIVSDAIITEIDLFAETIYNDSVLVRPASSNEGYIYEISGKHEGENYALEDPVSSINLPCINGLACIEWNLITFDRATGFIISVQYVGETCWSCGGDECRSCGGGGGETCFKNESELKTWEVGSVRFENSNKKRYRIESTEELIGQSYRDCSFQKSPIITGINHQSDNFYGPSNCSWTRTGVSTVKHSNDAASCKISGYVTEPYTDGIITLSLKIPLSNSNKWLAKSLW